ncbi:hypothetical protein V5799_015200 [Amblyomma americanum]|uniref:ditrans,polycis-polyprenyl diphosphate synthase [(2E,6E)-farnesyldiphosphate specific] n=1 Tax=Amblyomma americanum TaxID=6943 RepID=A0AAQ4E0U6_AMBAM
MPQYAEWRYRFRDLSGFTLSRVCGGHGALSSTSVGAFAMATDEARSFRSLVLDALSDLCRRLTMWLLMLDTVPTHVCMVPDGHRRFSKATGTDLRQAYAIGKRNVHLVSDWFFSVSALVVTVFVYSLRNFSRDQFEMRAALDKAKEGYEDILDNL